MRVFRDKKASGEPIAMISLYDAPSAAICCDSGVDVLLVGDSMGNVILGHDNTIAVTLDDMVRHTGAVVRGVQHSSRPDVPVIADLPFGSYQGSRDALTANARALMQAGAHGLKLEGTGTRALEAVDTLVQMGVPVMGHLGFTPQSSLALAEVVQGKTAHAADLVLRGARDLEAAGCCALLVEATSIEVAQAVTQNAGVPTIGIGAGPHCDGQVLVWHDLIGLSPQPPFRFVRRYAAAHDLVSRAARDYVGEVHSGAFPSTEHGWPMTAAEHEAWRLDQDRRNV